MSTLTCSVCGQPADLFAASDGGPCMSCVRARAKVATGGGRCVCPQRFQRPSEPKEHLGRRWISCERCLGTIRQLS